MLTIIEVNKITINQNSADWADLIIHWLLIMVLIYLRFYISMSNHQMYMVSNKFKFEKDRWASTVCRHHKTQKYVD